MFAKPTETKPASPPSAAIASAFAGLKPTPTVGKLAGLNPTSTAAPRTTAPPVAKGAMSAIAQAKAALFERAQQANSSPTTPVMAPNRASISSITSITSVGSARDPSSPTTPVSASPFRKSSVSSIGNNFRDNGGSQGSSTTTPVSASPFRKPSIGTTNGFKEPTGAPQGSSPTTPFTPTSLRKASISGMNTTWDPASAQATAATTPFTPKSLRKASISGMSNFKEPAAAVAPQASLPTATLRKLSISNGSGDAIQEIVSGPKTHSRTPSVDASTVKARSRAPSVSVDVSALPGRSHAPSISADVGDIKVRSRSASIHLSNTSVQAPLPLVDTTSEAKPTAPAAETQVAVPELVAVDAPAEIVVPDDVLAAVSIKAMETPVMESLAPTQKVQTLVEVLTPLEEPPLVELGTIESSAPVDTPVHGESATPMAIVSDVADSESTGLSQPEEGPTVAAEPVVAMDMDFAPTAVDILMDAELVSLIIPSKTKEEMLQSAPEEPVLSPVSTHASSHSRRSGVLPQKFHWKHGGEVVKVTGTFDDWKETVHLRKVPSTRDEFAAIVDLDRTKPIQFKFVVDGVWRCSTEFATEHDYHGNLNNVLPALSLEQCASHHH
ncbi:hypothetical protein BGZ75_002086 [Mortierella antarctica]|nr:hypothetical protein BGZ75_002086 [Mortierella antarctica]